MKNTPFSTRLPIAFRTTEREILQAAAERHGLAESTYVREVALAAARADLESQPDSRDRA